jgi:hypothetical protein
VRSSWAKPAVTEKENEYFIMEEIVETKKIKKKLKKVSFSTHDDLNVAK